MSDVYNPSSIDATWDHGPYSNDHGERAYPPTQDTGQHFALPVNHHSYYTADQAYQIDHSERAEWTDPKWDQTTSFSSQDPAIGMFQDSTELYGTDASQHLKLQSLPMLDSLVRSQRSSHRL